MFNLSTTTLHSIAQAAGNAGVVKTQAEELLAFGQSVFSIDCSKLSAQLDNEDASMVMSKCLSVNPKPDEPEPNKQARYLGRAQDLWTFNRFTSLQCSWASQDKFHNPLGLKAFRQWRHKR